MNKSSFRFIGAFSAALVALCGCKKEAFDVTTTNMVLPNSGAISAVDCPEFMLNIGDACTVGGQSGLVSVDCECLDPNSMDVIALEFVNEVSKELVVTVETVPAFEAGKTYVVVPLEGITLPYYLPLGTTSFSASAFYACTDFGVASASADYSNTPSVEGALVQLHVDCP